MELQVRGQIGILSKQSKNFVVGAINKNISNLCSRDTFVVFYDVTNYYFECEQDGFRNKGISKENRLKALVQMGLLQDADAIPLAYKLFSGNTHDSQTMLEVLDDMKHNFKVGRVVCVADKGLNGATNIAATIGRKDGFVYAQSIRGSQSSDSLRKWVIDNSGYTTQKNEAFKVKSGI